MRTNGNRKNDSALKKYRTSHELQYSPGMAARIITTSASITAWTRFVLRSESIDSAYTMTGVACAHIT